MILEDMKRKVIQLSVKTLVVSLPIEWANKNNIIKGSEVEVIDKGSKLLITNEKESNKQKILLDVENQVFDKRYLGDAYMKGYDEIKIKFKDNEILNEIRKIDLLGFEIVEKEEDYCIIKNVAAVLENEFDTMLRKCFLLTKEISLSIQLYFNGEKIDLKEVRKLEKENNKVSMFCLRILNKNGYKDNSKTNLYYVIVREIEAICDIYKYIIDDLLDGEKPEENSIKYFRETHKFLSLFYELFYKYDNNKWKIFYDKRKELTKTGRQLVKEKGTLSHHCLNLIVAINNLSGPFITMNFQ